MADPNAKVWRPSDDGDIDIEKLRGSVSGYAGTVKPPAAAQETESAGRVNSKIRSATSVILTTPNGNTHAVDYGCFSGPPVINKSETKLAFPFHGSFCDGEDPFSKEAWGDGVWLVMVTGERLRLVLVPLTEQRQFEIKVTGDEVPDEKPVVDGVAITKLSE